MPAPRYDASGLEFVNAWKFILTSRGMEMAATYAVPVEFAAKEVNARWRKTSPGRWQDRVA